MLIQPFCGVAKSFLNKVKSIRQMNCCTAQKPTGTRKMYIFCSKFTDLNFREMEKRMFYTELKQLFHGKKSMYNKLRHNKILKTALDYLMCRCAPLSNFLMVFILLTLIFFYWPKEYRFLFLNISNYFVQLKEYLS